MATEEATPVPKARKGLSSGVCNEFAAFLTVRPGHLPQLKRLIPLTQVDRDFVV